MRCIFYLLFLLPLIARAQGGAEHITMLSKDSLKRHYIIELSEKKNWKFHSGEVPGAADSAFDDSRWVNKKPQMYQDPEYAGLRDTFSSIGWFRLHFLADSSIAGIPLAFSMFHYGASEIYLDGKKLRSFGVIKGPDSSVYINPEDQPFAFVIPKAGEHVIAVRYANYDAARNYRLFLVSFSGFRLQLGKADNIAADIIGTLQTNSFVQVLLFGIFITLCVLHLLLYLYSRTNKSNLYFSIFCFCLGLIFLLSNLNMTASTPAIAKISPYAIILDSSILIFALSGFSNELFSRKKLRFRIVTAACVLVIPILLLDNGAGLLAYAVLLVFVLFEAILLTIGAIRRKVAGARIIGTGMLFFAIFIITIVAWIIIFQGLTFDDSVAATAFLLVAFCAILSLPASMSIYLSWNVKQHDELKAEKKKSDDLLLNILPAEVAEELKNSGNTVARQFDNVTVLFTDFVDFTLAGEKMGPQELVTELHQCFSAFDEIIGRYGIEKIKTIGDAYLAVCGLPQKDEDHAEKAVLAAQEMVAFMQQRQLQLGEKTFRIRIGIHSGSVVAGIVGVKKFAYDIWGDTVNTAARMEQHGEPGRINVSQTTYELLRDKFSFSFRGEIAAKNKGKMEMYFLDTAS